jgi:HEAT repeat protein
MGLFGPPNVDKLEAKGNVEGLISALGYPKKSYVRAKAAGALGAIGVQTKDVALRDQIIEALIIALKDGEVDVRAAAAGALGQIGDGRAVEPLIVMLNDKYQAAQLEKSGLADKQLIAFFETLDSKVREAAASALGQIGGASAVRLLLGTLRHSIVAGVRAAAANALGQIGDPQCISLLIASLQDSDEKVRVAASKALVKIGKPAVNPLIVALQDSMKEDEAGSMKQAQTQLEDARLRLLGIEPLSAELKNQYLGHFAMAVLGEIGDPRAVQALLGVLYRGKNSAMKEAATATLDKFGWRPGQDETSAVYWLVKGKWEKCIEIGAPAVKPLLAVIHARGEHAREAADTLAKLGWIPGQDGNGLAYWIAKREWGKVLEFGATAVEALIAELKDKDWKVREAASVALGQIGDPRAVAALIGMLEDSSAGKAAAQALVKIGTPAVDPLIARLGDRNWNVHTLVIDALGQLGGPGAVEALIAVLNDRQDNAREPAARALSQIGDARALEPLIAALENGGEGVRFAAAAALGKIYSKSGQVPRHARAVEALIISLKDKQSRVAQTSATALGQVGAQLEDGGLRARVVGALIEILNNGNGDLRYAAGALGQIGDPRAVDPLIIVLASDKYPARKAAAEALVRLYQSGHLDATCRQKILAQRDRMAADHNDQSQWVGNGSSSDCTGSTVHTDNHGIGVSFPV